MKTPKNKLFIWSGIFSPKQWSVKVVISVNFLLLPAINSFRTMGKCPRTQASIFLSLYKNINIQDTDNDHEGNTKTLPMAQETQGIELGALTRTTPFAQSRSFNKCQKLQRSVCFSVVEGKFKCYDLTSLHSAVSENVPQKLPYRWNNFFGRAGYQLPN